jgi:hypothetical protein
LAVEEWRWDPTKLAIGAGVLALAYLWLWLVALVDCIETAPDAKKTAWTVVIVFVPFGWLIYNLNKSPDTERGNQFDI